ncbi:DUF448 domain-containing protein [Sphingomonas changnyeongensis]|uniref:DUF448 domain-containing protein n=1 Tax=Sphingomonas changnyeongensis TaxID=2698679 RepID=UPI00389A4D6D
MRTLPNERPGSANETPAPELNDAPRGTRRAAADAERKCILTGQRADRDGLVRLALGPDGQVLPDVRAKAPGRGAWISADRTILDGAAARGRLEQALARAFRQPRIGVPEDLADRIAGQLERAALDRLGLEARAGTVLTGSERIETAARQGRVALLLHARDAAPDGSRRLDQALRVGSDAEGTALRGLVIAAPRAILSAALGRENAVHVGVVDAGAARRIGAALDRWHGFIGFGLRDEPCETASQGPIAAGAPDGAPAAAAANEGL